MYHDESHFEVEETTCPAELAEGNALEPRPGILAIPTCLPFKILGNPVQRRSPWTQPRCISSVTRPEDWNPYDEQAPKEFQKLLFRPLPGLGMDYIGLYLPIAANLSIVGGLSGWQIGKSTLVQRVWIIMWSVFGFVLNSNMALKTVADILAPKLNWHFDTNDWRDRAGRWILRKILNGGPELEKETLEG
ncbi:hypothetical protein PV04_04017 [Phialophora macrospora]|uniref:Uncharacterized protein n=1 Tax=Phialophora macrospora TaxID=1851006 RepID=A0A0D2E155_9EURO|nr:hypothetical protein PV04_04017 [Phialophora macrospora]